MRLRGVLKIAAAALLLSCAATWLDRYRGVLGRLLVRPAPHATTAPLGLGEEIDGQRERALISRVSQAYGEAKAQLDAARSKKLGVRALEPMLLYSLELARQKRYDEALTLLNRIEMDVPREREPVVAARSDDPLPADPGIRTKRVPRAKGLGRSGGGERP